MINGLLTRLLQRIAGQQLPRDRSSRISSEKNFKSRKFPSKRMFSCLGEKTTTEIDHERIITKYLSVVTGIRYTIFVIESLSMLVCRGNTFIQYIRYIMRS